MRKPVTLISNLISLCQRNRSFDIVRHVYFKANCQAVANATHDLARSLNEAAMELIVLELSSTYGESLPMYPKLFIPTTENYQLFYNSVFYK